jgi:hypothetical protein
MFDTLKSFLQPQSSAVTIITVNSPVNYEEIPKGFFRVRRASGKESLGFKGSFLAWNVGETVVDGNQRVTLTTPRAELPLVELNFQRPAQDGAQHFGNTTVVDTDTLEEDTTVVWAGQSQRSGVEWL